MSSRFAVERAETVSQNEHMGGFEIILNGRTAWGKTRFTAGPQLMSD